MPTTKLTLPTQIDLEQFISEQAHDMRTPFNHIIGFTKMTLNTVADAPLTDYQKEDLATIYRSGMRALTLMNGIIDIARLKRGEKDVKPADTPVEQVIEQSLAQWRKFNPDNETRIEYQVAATSRMILADDQLIRQVIVGFIAFVAQYCEANIAVRIEVADEPEWSILTFTSVGTKSRMPSELDLQMIGYINRAIVELHNGEIRTAEENDLGAVVQIALPKARPDQPSPPIIG